MIEGAIFDIDGTLIDSVEAHAQAWAVGFRDSGIDVDLQALRRQIGKGSDQLLPTFLDKEDVSRIGKIMETRQSEVFKASYVGDIRAFPGVRELFERLRTDRVKCVLGSSGKPADVEQAQKIADITGLVDAMATSEDVDASKPSPDIVQVALKRMTPTRSDRCVFVGDTPWDAEAAGRAGVVALGISSAVFGDEELRAAGCRAVFPSIEAMLVQYDQLLHFA